ncbi:DinB family protein [Gemmatimonas sp. UBA7669]|uniref:DinB family protein n=1 Tax=Gemmatimonas sp. UBA7669 TaxID=1946568 RepID=UPI0025BC25CF|nr:DinB family protein [Gemmatimonas sp. UBA7669]
MTQPVLHPRMAEVIDALSDAQEEMIALLATVPPALLHAHPSSDVWSVAQIVDHLAIVEDGTGRLVSKLIKSVADTVDTDETPIAPTLARYQIPNPVTRIDAPAMVAPSSDIDYEAALARQQTARQRLIAALVDASGRALSQASAPHAIFGPLDGYQWALFVALHQRRHLVQISTTLAALTS